MGNVSHLQNIYAGEFHPAMDEKNRITIPARWRGDDGQDFILLPDKSEEFLLVMLHEEFARVIAEADANVPARDRRVFFRHLHARAQHAASDKQGRLVLPDEFCRLLELNGEVTLVGGRGRFEIWNTKKWKQAHKTEKATYQRVADEIGL